MKLKKSVPRVLPYAVLYDAPIGENGMKLSGGERRRIPAARALRKDAPIVPPDEATASLGAGNETKVRDVSSRPIAGKIVPAIAHRRQTVPGADGTVVPKDGTAAEEGRPEDLPRQENSLFRRMAERQTAGAGQSV